MNFKLNFREKQNKEWNSNLINKNIWAYLIQELWTVKTWHIIIRMVIYIQGQCDKVRNMDTEPWPTIIKTNLPANGSIIIKREQEHIHTQMAKSLRGNGYKVKNLIREQCILMINNILRVNINKINCMEMLLNMTSMALFCQSLNGGTEIL